MRIFHIQGCVAPVDCVKKSFDLGAGLTWKILGGIEKNPQIWVYIHAKMTFRNG